MLKAVKKTSFLSIIMTIFLTLFICSSCRSSGTQKTEENGKTRILASFYPIYIMLENLCQGADVELSMIAPADTGCLHDYQLTTGDMKRIEKCDILVINGAGMEDFVEKALELKDSGQIINASQGYELFDDNAHIWVSPEGAIYECTQIAMKLALLDPDKAELYLSNCRKYVDEILMLQEEMHSRLDACRGKSIITFHEAFPYFAKEFDLVLLESIERDAGTDPGARELTQLIKMIRREQSQNSGICLFAEENYSSSAGAIISQETGLRVWELDPGVTGKMEKDSYLEAMRKNLLVLEEAFK